MSNYQKVVENILNSITIIADEKIKSLPYDKTIICTIIDDINKDYGEYTVSDGSSEFLAYTTDTGYATGNSVYVTVPNGDYSKQKIISAKYTTGDSFYYSYKKPFESFLQITDNIIEADKTKEEHFLTANGSVEEIEIYSIDNFNFDTRSYGRLGLSAFFKATLNDLNATSGNYGLRLEIIPKEDKDKKYIRILDVSDMYGDPYNMPAYQEWQGVFDISQIPSFGSLKIIFFQDNNFNNVNGRINYTFDGIEDKQQINENLERLKNISVKDIQLIFGYNLSDYNGDKLILYSEEVTLYKYNSTKSNEKTMQLRWIHKDGANTLAIEGPGELPDGAIVHWYHYNHEDIEDVSDSLAGDFWEEIVEAKGCFTYKITPDLLLQEEKYKVIIELNTEAFESDELIFENVSLVPNKATINLIQGLKLSCDDNGYNGVYNLYDSLGNIISKAENVRERKITASYQSMYSSNEETHIADIIEWRIPKINTMIEVPQLGIEYSEEDVFYEDDSFYIIKRMNPYRETRDLTQTDIADSGEQIFRIKAFYLTAATNNTIYCTITRNGYSQSASQSLVFGTTGTNGTDYTFKLIPQNSKTFSVSYFNYAADGVTREPNVLVLRPFLFDYKNEQVELNEIECKWANSGNNFLSLQKSGKDIFISLSMGDGVLSESDSEEEASEKIQDWYHVLKVTAKNIQNANGTKTELTLYQPIAVSLYNETCPFGTIVSSLDIVDLITYDSFGTNPLYFKDKCQLYEMKNGKLTKIDGVDWSGNIQECDSSKTSKQKDKIKEFYPMVKTNGLVIPTGMYLRDNEGYCINAFKDGVVIWNQPVHISQNAYESSFLNNWDGNLTFDEKNGTLLSPILGAGFKDSKNTFNGILMGDVKQDQSVSETGLYGYNSGEQSFGFKIDGTAFIGKSGTGRIQFDGNEGIIESSNYLNNQTGLHLNLSTGKFISRSDAASIIIDPSNKQNVFFNIKAGASERDILKVGGTYFLQSIDFSDDNQSGTKIDLQNGKITSFNLDLRAAPTGNISYTKISIPLQVSVATELISNTDNFNAEQNPEWSTYCFDDLYETRNIDDLYELDYSGSTTNPTIAYEKDSNDKPIYAYDYSKAIKILKQSSYWMSQKEVENIFNDSNNRELKKFSTSGGKYKATYLDGTTEEISSYSSVATTRTVIKRIATYELNNSGIFWYDETKSSYKTIDKDDVINGYIITSRDGSVIRGKKNGESSEEDEIVIENELNGYRYSEKYIDQEEEETVIVYYCGDKELKEEPVQISGGSQKPAPGHIIYYSFYVKNTSDLNKKLYIQTVKGNEKPFKLTNNNIESLSISWTGDIKANSLALKEGLSVTGDTKLSGAVRAGGLITANKGIYTPSGVTCNALTIWGKQIRQQSTTTKQDTIVTVSGINQYSTGSGGVNGNSTITINIPIEPVGIKDNNGKVRTIHCINTTASTNYGISFNFNHAHNYVKTDVSTVRQTVGQKQTLKYLTYV